MFGASGKVANAEGNRASGVYTVTEGTAAPDYYGYSGNSNILGLVGSIDRKVYQGQSIEAIFYWAGSTLFYVYLDGNLAQDFFTAVTPEGGSRLTTASATHGYASGAGATYWRWTHTPSGWDGSGTREVLFED